MKDIIRLTEADLHNLVGEAVKSYLNEYGRVFSPEEYEDKAFMDDYYAQREEMMNDAWEDKNRRIRQQYPGKSEEWYEAMLDIFENKKASKTIKESWRQAPWEQIDPVEDADEYQGETPKESFQNNQGYSHFAVNKATGKIVNGWDYADYDPSELRQFKNDYFTRDLIDYELDPKQYKIVTGKYLLRQGIDPNDNNNWANN